jgi:superfamily II DNA or RNA helicase
MTMVEKPGPLPKIEFKQGSILISSELWTADCENLLSGLFNFDSRTGQYRALGQNYAEIVLTLYRHKIPYRDEAKAFGPVEFRREHSRQARPYQQAALEAWLAHQKRGLVVLPTGAGKSFLAILAIERTARPCLVVVPTLDLVNQWARDCEASLGVPVGIWGGGEHRTESITISTYDSAQIHMEHEGNAFGFVIFDECHHLPGPSYRWIAKMAIAPYRLGLSATPERGDGGEVLLQQLIGPEVYRAEISELKGRYLSHYETQLVEVPLDLSEATLYQEQRAIYTQFVREQGIDFSGPQGWQDFLGQCFKSEAGREAYRAYRNQKDIVKNSTSKLKVLWELLYAHRHEQVLIFTNDNETAYGIGEKFCLPVLTHQTRIKERKKIMEAFKSGELPWLVTSKVLNEGVDVPKVNVGIIVSGSGSVREHVQRLGRLLRKDGDRPAQLIELVSLNTAEKWQSQRRRDHAAYGK